MNEASKTSPQQMSLDLPSVTSSPASGDGLLRCEWRDGPTTAKSGPVPAHASLSARQARALGLVTIATCGPTFTGSSSSAALQSSLVSRLQAQLQGLGSTLYSLTWKPWVLPSGRSLSRLRGSVRRTCETERSGWVTPTTRDHKDTPGMVAQRDGRDRNDQLPRQAYLAGWTTPTAQDHSRGNGAIRPHDTGLMLAQHAALSGWPTPTVADKHKGPHHAADTRIKGSDLPTMAHWCNQPARLTATGELLTGSAAAMESGGQLNPAHSRWLMAYPAAWDEAAIRANRSIQPKRASRACADTETR